MHRDADADGSSGRIHSDVVKQQCAADRASLGDGCIGFNDGYIQRDRIIIYPLESERNGNGDLEHKFEDSHDLAAGSGAGVRGFVQPDESESERSEHVHHNADADGSDRRIGSDAV